MPVPASINDIFTTAGSNPPGGGETPAEGDNHIRAAYSFIATLRDILNGASATTAAIQTLVVSGNATFNGNTTIGDAGSDTLTIRCSDISLTGVPTITGAATWDGAVAFGEDPTGRILGLTYSPTLTNGAEVSSSTPSDLQYARIGPFVIVSGQVSVTTSSNIGNLFSLGISLPVPSSFTAVGQLGGSGADASTQTTVRPVEFIADFANDRASMRGRVTVGATPFTYSFMFAYQVI